ncbi:acyl-CoA N-acyltransferase [Kalaharituber pfeilii]|nr:acyl-CoA N-acyltransferase [Kalaharituber pfeilii]
MRLRPARPQDLPFLVSIVIAAFDSETIVDYQCPGRRTPSLIPEYVKWWLSLYSSYLLTDSGDVASDPNRVIVVVETDVDPSLAEIIGSGIWIKKMLPPSIPSEQGQQQKVNVQLFKPDAHPPNLCASEEHIAQYHTAFANACHTLFNGEFKPHWHLSWIAVRPSQQCKGVGSMILNWGLARAREEGVPAILEALPWTTKGFYEKHGMVKKADVMVGTYEVPLGLLVYNWESDGAEANPVLHSTGDVISYRKRANNQLCRPTVTNFVIARKDVVLFKRKNKDSGASAIEKDNGANGGSNGVEARRKETRRGVERLYGIKWVRVSADYIHRKRDDYTQMVAVDIGNKLVQFRKEKTK